MLTLQGHEGDHFLFEGDDSQTAELTHDERPPEIEALLHPGGSCRVPVQGQSHERDRRGTVIRDVRVFNLLLLLKLSELPKLSKLSGGSGDRESGVQQTVRDRRGRVQEISAAVPD